MFKLWSGGLAWGMQKSTEVKNETLHSVNALRNEHISVDTFIILHRLDIQKDDNSSKSS